MVIQRVVNLQFNSSAARLFLSNFYSNGHIYRVPFGPLRGMKLAYDTSINYHMMLGVFDRVNVSFILHLLKRRQRTQGTLTIADIGANIGYFSLAMSRALSSYGRIDAFEPAPETFERLCQNVTLNNASNISVHQVACANETGEIAFYVGWHHHTSSLVKTWAQGQYSEASAIKVNAMKLDDFYYSNNRPHPQFIKMDIEGGAVFALKGCSRLGQEQRPNLLIESHTPDEDAAISKFMIDHEYEGMRTNTKEWVMRRDEIHPHPLGVWGTLFLVPKEHAPDYE